MILTTQQLYERYSDFSNKAAKISRDMKSGRLILLVKGLYETDAKTDGIKLQFIYGPSYLSFDYVLYAESLIPEVV